MLAQFLAFKVIPFASLIMPQISLAT